MIPANTVQCEGKAVAECLRNLLSRQCLHEIVRTGMAQASRIGFHVYRGSYSLQTQQIETLLVGCVLHQAVGAADLKLPSRHSTQAANLYSSKHFTAASGSCQFRAAMADESRPPSRLFPGLGGFT